jgi:hypothetical protein
MRNRLTRRTAAISEPAVILVAGFLPGALVGTHLAGLLFFLNPHLPLLTGQLLIAVGFYGMLLGLASLLVHLPWTWGRWQRAKRLLPWSLTGALLLSAALDWTHASYYAFYLPSGINVRLIKAAAWLSIAGLISFYTALLHTLNHRPYGWRSRVGLFLLAAASIYLMVERREAFKPRRGPAPRPSRVEAIQRPRLIAVGLDGATLDAILPLGEQGRLPFFSRLLQEGSYARLSSVTPNRREVLWTTVATGKYPYKHGVLGDHLYYLPVTAGNTPIRLLPAGLGFKLWGTSIGRAEPTDFRAQKTPSIWQILPNLGVRTAMVGWPNSAPVPPGLAYALTDRFFQGPDWPQSAHPQEVAERGRLFHLEPQEIDPVLLDRFGADPPPDVVEALAEDIWIETLTSFLVEQEREVEAIFLVLPGLARVSRLYFAAHAAVYFDGIRSPHYLEAAELLEAYYRHLDEFLEDFWNRTGGGPRLLAIFSAHGVEAPTGWRRAWRELIRRPPTRGTFRGSPDGVLLLYGETIEPGSLLTAAELVDVVPTLLYGLRFPLARDLDGRVLEGAFTSEFLARNPRSYVPAYETLRGQLP